ncbi:MAG: hypothetical protein F6K18_14205 [Okeania sp. SIO2C2]|uniref:hypothetical protein n=1 Tax=Okeania sp. SIO2C2 TaxID=2607787 RepID=UPI0013B7A4F0|nr:hypothetical protein [Okeania sp. SIO2C2]NEP87876.1 hypothetical protein [Okeania sp. SIO2C2]
MKSGRSSELPVEWDGEETLPYPIDQEKLNFSISMPHAFLGHAAQTAVGTDN